MAGISKSFKESYVAGMKKAQKSTPAKEAANKVLAKHAKRKSRLSKLKRTAEEAVHGSKTYLPKTAKMKRSEGGKATWKTQGEMAKAENLGSELQRLRKKGKK